MSHSFRSRWRWASLGLLVTFLSVLPASQGMADEMATSILVRTDTDGTTVITPRIRALAQVGDSTHIGAAYTTDVWSSASVDIRTSASRRIHEQRDEVEFDVDHAFGDLTLRAAYRFSHELDYRSHGLSLGGDFDFAGGSSTLGLQLSLGTDHSGHSGDPILRHQLTSLNGRITYTQILDTKTLMQLVYEYSWLNGFQSSEYRFVGIGGSGQCSEDAEYCIHEVQPSLRMRHAAVVRVRRALGDSASIGADYRFYIDSWNVLAHTARLSLAYLPNDASTLGFAYRLHRQGSASFYHSVYWKQDLETEAYFTRDRELSALTSHRVTLSYEHDFDVFSAGIPMRLSLAASGTLFQYDDFVGLDKVWALDVIVGTRWEL